MKIIGIVGSPKKIKGNTGRLMLEVLKSAEKEGATFETVDLPGGGSSSLQSLRHMSQKRILSTER
jgi:multimeric flavodoxin WrbA